MGLGDVSGSVIPKPVLLAPGADPSGLSLRSRYFTPQACHRAHAATGAVGVAGAFLMPGTVAHGCGGPAPQPGYRSVRIEHPSGGMEIDVKLDPGSGEVQSAGLVRTARKIMKGLLYVPGRYAPARQEPIAAVA
jgi:2-methylaconitate cis-trans-isomerase PrpF